MMTIQEYLNQYIDWTAEEVANIFRWRQCKGSRKSASGCIIAQDLDRHCGFSHRVAFKLDKEVIIGKKLWGSDSWYRQEAAVPSGLQDFVKRFDDKEWPELTYG